MWNQTRVSELLGIRYPIIQGPFGGGLSTIQLTAIVSNAGGMGAFGAHRLSPPSDQSDRCRHQSTHRPAVRDESLDSAARGSDLRLTSDRVCRQCASAEALL